MRLIVARGNASTRTEVQVPAGGRIAVEAVDVGDSAARLVAVRVDAGLERRFVLVDVHAARPRVVAVLGPFAADEEHRASVVARRSAGQRDLVVGVAVQFTDACGAHTAIVAPHSIDLERGSARALGPILVEEAPSATLATAPVPEGTARPTFSSLAFDSGVSLLGATSSGLDSLGDADARTTFPTAGGAAFGALNLRYPLAPLRLRGLVVDPVRGEGGGRALLLRRGDTLQRIEVGAGSGPVMVSFDRPVEGRCLSLLSTGGTDSARAIATLYAIPEADGDAAVQRLVAELADDGERADLAVQALAHIGTPALAALEATFAEATTPERMKILEVARMMVPREPNALRLFVLGMESDDEAVARMALERSISMGAPGNRALAVAVRRGNVRIARTLAERAPDLAIETLLGRLSESSGDAETTGLREALIVAARRSPQVGQTALRAYVAGSANATARAAALSVMTTLGDADGISAVLDSMLAAETEPTVATSLRWLEAASAIPAVGRSEAVRALVRNALASDVWMVREHAVSALASDPDARPLVRERLEDPYPRVRVAAVAALANDRDSLRRLGELSRRDEWPMVRLEALLAIAAMPEAEPLLRDALGDRSIHVRVGVFEWAGRAGDTRFVAEAMGIVERGRAPTAVIVACIEYLERLCFAPAQSALVAAVDRAVGQTTERERTIGQSAAHALERLGDEDGVRAARRLVDPTRGGLRPPERCTPRADR